LNPRIGKSVTISQALWASPSASCLLPWPASARSSATFAKKRELANGKADSLLYLLVIQVRGSFDVDG
jgi:hypothetical protein